MPISQRLSRRTLIGGISSFTLAPLATRTFAQPATPEATPSSFDWPEPVSLGQGLFIRDWRLFPSDEGNKLIVELYSDRDDVINTPAVGFELPATPSDFSALWAVPWEQIVRPQSSTILVAVLPDGEVSNQDIRNAEGWTPCAMIEPVDQEISEAAKALTVDNVNWEYWTEGRHYWADIINASVTAQPIHVVKAIVRDLDGRIAGGAFCGTASLSGGEYQTFHVWITPGTKEPIHPAMLLANVNEMDVEFRVSPFLDPISPGCPAIMPWNR